MSKKIEFTEDGTKYVLEYNREAIKLLEAQGFSVSEMTSKPMTMIELAFEGLFYKNHRRVKKDFIQKCYDKFTNKEKLIEVIGEMLAESYEPLTSESEATEGNIDWEIIG